MFAIKVNAIGQRASTLTSQSEIKKTRCSWTSGIERIAQHSLSDMEQVETDQ